MVNKYHVVVTELELEKLVEVLTNIEARLQSIENFQAKEPVLQSNEPTLMTRAEVSKFFQVNMSTVRNWSISGILQPYYIGDRVYFKRSEVMNALIPAQLSIKH